MRKIRITESQYRLILESEEIGYPLNTKADDGKPDNFTGYEVASDNTDDDAPMDVTDMDNVSDKTAPNGWFGMRRFSSMYRLPEGQELDNKRSSGFGVKYDAQITNQAKNGGGKMVKNVSAEISSNKGGTRNNTNQVRISRMEDQKVNDPAAYAKNGGDATLKILKSQVKKTSAIHNAVHSEDEKKTNVNPNVTSKTSEKKPNNGIIYFK